MVVQLDLAEFDVVLRADPHRGEGLQLRPGGIKTYPVGMEGAAVLRQRIGRRMLGDGDQLRLLVPAQIEKAAVSVAQCVVAPTRDTQLAMLAAARPIGAQRQAVAPVGQHMGWLHRTGAGQHVAQQTRRPLLQGRQCRAAAGGRQGGDFARWALMQQGRYGLDMRVGHAPALRHTAQQHVGQCHDAHPLVMRHEGAHRSASTRIGLARRREVERLDEPVVFARPELLQCREIE